MKPKIFKRDGKWYVFAGEVNIFWTWREAIQFVITGGQSQLGYRYRKE